MTQPAWTENNVRVLSSRAEVRAAVKQGAASYASAWRARFGFACPQELLAMWWRVPPA